MADDLRYLIDLVKEASLMITDEFIVKAKDDQGDLVTNFDLAIEKFMIEKLNEKYPNFDIISEEYNSDKALTDNCFTIDPIDGTINFAHNIPIWAIQIAMIKEGNVVASVIYAPKLDELYYADSNGAYLNGLPIHVNSIPPRNGLYCIEGNGGAFKNNDNFLPRNYRDFHCASLSFAYVACGRLNGIIFNFHTYWDYVPGMYLIKQAGGITYDEANRHLAANNEEYLSLLKANIN